MAGPLSLDRGVKCTFEAPNTPGGTPIRVIQPARLGHPSIDQKINMWAGSLSVRLQGHPSKIPSPKALAELLPTDPAFRVAVLASRWYDLLAFTYVEQERRPFSRKPPVSVWKQAGVAWNRDTVDPGVALEPYFRDGLAATMFCDAREFDPEAEAVVLSYNNDTRSSRFFEEVGFRPVKGPEWGHRGARLATTCGALVSELAQQYDFLAPYVPAARAETAQE